MAIFGYGRVSTSQQDTENQRLELGQAGWQIDYWFTDVVSGKVPAMQRKAFSEMLNKILIIIIVVKVEFIPKST